MPQHFGLYNILKYVFTNSREREGQQRESAQRFLKQSDASILKVMLRDWLMQEACDLRFAFCVLCKFIIALFEILMLIYFRLKLSKI